MNKFRVVTGGTKGIGRAIAERFAAESFDVFTCSRNAQELRSLKESLEEKYQGCRVYTHVADLSKKDEVESFTTAVKAMNRIPDILVNNAGYFIPGEITTEKDGTLERMMNANLFSAYHTTRGLAGPMKKAKKGHIFNICSIASIQAYPNGGSYAITKAALLGFSRCLREELKTDGIRVTSVLPGATLTASWEGIDLPESRFMKSQDVAETVFSAWKLSERSVVEEIVIRPQLGDL